MARFLAAPVFATAALVSCVELGAGAPSARTTAPAAAGKGEEVLVEGVDTSGVPPCLVVCGDGCDGDWFALTCEGMAVAVDLDCETSYDWSGDVFAVSCVGTAEFESGAAYGVEFFYLGEDECFSSVDVEGVGTCISS